MKRIIPALVGAALLIGILAAITAWFLSPAYLGPALAQLVRAQSGLELRLKERADLQLLPHVEVRIAQAELYTPSGEKLASLPEIILRPSLADILARRMGGGEVELAKPEFNLTIPPEGTPSWAKGGAGATGWQGAIIIRDGKLKFLDERSGDNFSASEVDGRVTFADGFGFTGGLNWGQDRLQLSAFIRDPARLAADGSPADITAEMSRLRFTFSGQAQLVQGIALAGRMEAESPDLLELARWSGFEVPASAQGLRFSASGAFEGKAGRVGFTGADYQIQGMNAQGDLSLIMRANRPQLRARLGFDRLELDSLSGLMGLPRAEAQMALATRSLHWAGLQAGASSLAVNLKEGVLGVKLQQVALGTGSAKGEFTIETQADIRKLSASLELAGADARQSLGWLTGTARVEGKLNLSLALAAQGKTPDELLASLSGKGNLVLSEASLLDLDIPGLVKAVGQKVVTGWAPVSGARTGVERLSASFSLVDGVATAKDFTLDGTRVKLSGTADVDFLRRALLLRLDADLAAEEGGKPKRALAVPIIAEGPWASPKFYPDMPGVLANPAKAYAALKAMQGTP